MECRWFGRNTALSHVDELHLQRVSSRTPYWDEIWVIATSSQCYPTCAPLAAPIVRNLCPEGAALSVTPTSRETTIPSHLFRVVLLRRLRFSLSLSLRSCRCGSPLDPSGHHRAACSQAGMLGRRGYALDSIVARICREAGGWVRANFMLRDMDVAQPHVHDGSQDSRSWCGWSPCSWRSASCY